MAQFDLDRIFNNAENQSQKKKKKYDIDRILNSAEDISTRNTTMGTIPAITGSAIQATNKIIAPMAKTTTNLTEADLRKIEQNSGLKTGTLNLNKMQAQQQKFENLQQKGNEILQDKNNKIYDVDYIYSDLGIDNGKVFKKSSAFKDGYDFGDITKTVLDTGATLGTEVTKGVANIGENIGDLASYGIAGVADLLGEDEYADKVRKNAQVSLVDKYTKPLSSKIDKNSILGSKGKEMAQSLGYVAGTAAIGTATGGTAGILGKTAEGAAKAANIATTATTFASSMGSGITEAYQNGATDQEALAYGIISGIGEAGSELMFGGLGKVFGKVGFNPTGGALDEVVVQGLSRNIKNKMVKTLVQSGLMATGEGIEEVVSGVVSAIGKKATFMKEEDLKNLLKDENLAEQFWMGTLTSVIAQAPSTISSIKNKTDYLTGEKWEITQKNETPESPQNVQNNIEQQTIQTDTKTAQNRNVQETKPNGINTLIKELDYFETAKKYNIDTKNDTVQSIARVTNERGIKARYDADVFNDNSQNAIWKISKDNNGNTTREVIINPNADTKKSLENIAIHELTHDLEGTEQYNKLRDLILEYDKTKSGYQEARQSLEELYSNVYDKNSEEFNTLVDSEAVADILGSKLGNQEFVNNLTIKNKNLGQRIYSWVIDKLNRLNAKLGYKSEKIYWTDVKNKFENAFKQEYNGLNTNTNRLSIAGIQGMNNAIKADTSNISLERMFNKAKQMEKHGIDNETIRQQTNWFQDKNGNWKFEFTDKNMTLKNNIKIEKNSSQRLESILKHDTLFMVYPELKDINVEFSNMGDINGSYNAKNNRISLNNSMVNNNRAIEGTLIHEIQHAIQNIENFERGAKSNKSKLAYYNSLGEIEAADTKERFLNEKYKNKNIFGIAPESSKANPKHKELNKYLENRNIIDKAKDNIYNYFKKKGDYNENFEYFERNEKQDNKEDSKLVSERNRRSSGSNGALGDSTLENGRKIAEKVQENETKIYSKDKEIRKTTQQNGEKDNGKIWNNRVDGKIQESENNSGSFNFDKNVKRYEDLQEAKAIKFNKKTDGTINIEITNDNELINQLSVDSKDNALKQLGSDIANYIYDNATEDSKTIRLKQTKNIEVHDTSHKGKQLEIIKKTNPMLDDYHVGIRNVEDIKAFNEVLNDEDSFVWGDFTREDAKKALKEGKITVYSSYPINQGTFVSTSKIQAEQYAGGKGNKIYSKTIPLEEVAWINGDEGQYANTTTRYSKNNQTWQDYLEKNYKTAGTRTNLEDIKINNNIAPIGKNVKRGPLIEEIAPKATTQVKNSFDKNEDFKVPKVLKDIPKDKSPLKVLKDEFIQATVNKGHYVDQLAKQKNNPELTYKYDRNLGAFAEGQFTIGRGQTDNNGKIIGKSVKEIWKPAEKANLVNEFSEYLLYKHNVDRINQNNPLLGYEINAPQSAEIAKKLETKYPQFKEWAKDVYTYYDNELQNFVDAGLITEEFKNQLNEMYPHYVKISRNIENNFNVKSDEKVAGGKNPIKRATGGNSDILPLKETMASYAIQAKKAIRQNELGKEVANTLKLKDVIKKNNKSVYEEIARTNDSNAAADMFFNSINNSLVDNSDGQTKLIYYDDGDIVNVKIDDKLYKSLDTKDVFKDFENSNILTKAVSKSLQKVSKIQRDLLTTYNLGFAMVNPIKDIQDGAFNSKYPGKFAQNYAKAIGEMTKGKKSELYMLYLANGGNSNTYYEYDTKMPTKNYKFGDGINKANEVVETLPRFAEFISTIENGGSINEAMYNAAEITTNFKRGGNFTKFLNRNGANFLNASVQGLSKQIRNITGQNGWKGYAQLITKSVLLGVAPALLNDVLLGDDDEYEELPDYIKDEYYLFKKSDGNFVRIPKGRVLSVIGMTARRTVEATKGNEEAFDNWWSEVVSQMAPNNPLEDNITAPIKAVKDNKTWYGTNIVSSRLQKELPKNQYDETTDEFSKWLGEKINVSPKKINYLIDQYSGGIGDIVLPKITPQAKDNIIQDKFTANSTLKNKNPGKFYELLEASTQLANDVEPVESDVLKAKYLNSVNSDMSKLYKEKRTIQMSDMTQEAKKEAVEEIQSKINSLAEQAINESNNVTTNSNYATVRR
jgi:hypothetical protein